MTIAQRYQRAAHAIQSAIAFCMTYLNYHGADPKHMRVGIDTLKAEQAGLAQLLIEKGVFTPEEYGEAMAKALEQEAARYTQSARELSGIDKLNFG